MTESDRKLLTEYLGEEWHKPNSADCKCGERHPPMMGNPNRTFDTIQDFYDLKCKLVEKGKWGNFVIRAKNILIEPEGLCGCNICLSHFLIHPARCQTVADWLKERKNDS